MAMPAEVQDLVAQLFQQSTRYTLKINTIRHQYANSECGIYSMMFILKSRNKSFEQIAQDIIVDEMANKYRSEFFRQPS